MDIKETFEKRPKLTLEDAKKVLLKEPSYARHILKNEDGTYSVFFHSHCEVCCYCKERSQKFRDGLRGVELILLIHQAQEDPYQNRALSVDSDARLS